MKQPHREDLSTPLEHRGSPEVFLTPSQHKLLLGSFLDGLHQKTLVKLVLTCPRRPFTLGRWCHYLLPNRFLSLRC